MGERINTLISSGFDAFTNLYDIEITFPTILFDSENPESQTRINNFSVRSTEFTPPSLNPDLYDIYYKTIKLRRPKPKIVGARRLPISFRIDDAYDVYEYLKKWKKLYGDENRDKIRFGGLSDPDQERYLGKIVVKAYKSHDTSTPITNPTGTDEEFIGIKYIYEQCLCLEVVEPTFNHASSEPVKVQATFLFGGHTIETPFGV